MPEQELAAQSPVRSVGPLAGSTPRSVPPVPAAIASGVLVLALLGELAGEPRIRGAALLLGVLVPVAVLPGVRRRVVGVAALAGAWLAAVVAMDVLPRHFSPRPAVTVAVGGAAYFDTPYMGAQVAEVLGLSLVLAVGLVVAVALRRAGRAPAAVAFPAAPMAPADRRTRRLLLAGCALVALTLVPDVRAFVNNGSAVAPYNWDVGNGVAWVWFLDHGLVPMKDFFYPYGHTWVFRLLPAGGLLEWLDRVALLSLVAWSVWRLSGRRVVPVVLCLGAVAVAGTWTPSLWRYLPALVVPATYAALGPARHTRLARGHLVFGAACLFTALLEADLLIYALAGCGLVFMGELASGAVALGPLRLLRALALDALPFVGAVALLLLVWVASGSFDGNASFLGDLRGTSAASAPNELQYGGLVNFFVRPSAASVRIAAPALLLAAGLMLSLVGRPRQRAVGSLLLAASGVTFCLVLKHLVRPVDQLTMIPFVALLWAAILLWERRTLPIALAVGAFVGATVAEFQQTNSVSGYVGGALQAPANVVRSADILVHPGQVEAARRARFADQRFAAFTEPAAAADYRRAVGGSRDFAVLGDAQLLYPLLRGTKVPFHYELYDAARVREQRKMVAELRAQSPRYLLWRRDFAMDDVPYPVRTPMVFAYAIQHYAPVRLGATTDILRARRPGEPIDLKYWTGRLGTIDLGFIPSISRGPTLERCSGGAGCVEYALVRGRARTKGQDIRLQVHSRRGDFEAVVRGRRDVDRYGVRLDRLWFWPLVGASRLESATPGFDARVVKVRAGDDLY